jgi:hypothetical protein
MAVCEGYLCSTASVGTFLIFSYFDISYFYVKY